MASLPLTANRRNSILTLATTGLRNRADKEQQALNDLLLLHRDSIWTTQILEPEVIEAVRVVPALVPYMNTTTFLNIQVKAPDVQGHRNFRLVFPENRFITRDKEYTTHVLSPRVPCYEEAIQLFKRCVAFATEADQLTRDLQALMDKFTTVNQLQKVWPAVTQYLSSGDLDQLHYRPLSVKKERDAVEMDPETKSRLVKAAMLGAA